MLFTNPYKQIVFRVSSFWVNECLSGASSGPDTLFPRLEANYCLSLAVLMLTRSELSKSKPGLRPPSITLLIRESQRRARAALLPGCLVPRVWMGLLCPPLLSCLMSLHVTRCHSPGEHYQCHHHSLSLNTRPVLWEEADCLKISDQSRHYRAEIVTGAGYHYRHSI